MACFLFHASVSVALWMASNCLRTERCNFLMGLQRRINHISARMRRTSIKPVMKLLKRRPVLLRCSRSTSRQLILDLEGFCWKRRSLLHLWLFLVCQFAIKVNKFMMKSLCFFKEKKTKNLSYLNWIAHWRTGSSSLGNFGDGRLFTGSDDKTQVTVSSATCGTSNAAVSEQVAATLASTSEMLKKQQKPAYHRQNAVEIPLEMKEEEEVPVNPLANLVLLEGADGILQICMPNGRGGLMCGKEAVKEAGKEAARRPVKRSLNSEQGPSAQSTTKKAKITNYDADDESGRLTPKPLVIDD